MTKDTLTITNNRTGHAHDVLLSQRVLEERLLSLRMFITARARFTVKPEGLVTPATV